MEHAVHRFHDLDEVIDEVHALFRQWDREGLFYPPATPMLLERVKLAVHEWIANLVQHADFDEENVEICLSMRNCGGRLRCTIEDNSSGFDMNERKESGRRLLRDLLETLPERGMGLMLVEASTEDLTYQRIDANRYLLQFFVSPE